MDTKKQSKVELNTQTQSPQIPTSTVEIPTPIETEPFKKSFPKRPIILICLMFLVAIIFLFCPRPKLVQITCTQTEQLQSPCKAGKQITWEISLLVHQLLVDNGYYLPKPLGLMHSVIISSPTPDPTANWKTYTNTQYAYSVKYPADYSVIETSSDYVHFSPGINDPNLPQRQTYLSIQLDNNPQQLPEAVYKKTADGKTLRISQILMDVDENQKHQIKEIFDQILSTFKFINQSRTATPTISTVPLNWIPHTFNTYGLTIYSPDDWQSSITDYPENSESLIKFWKKSSPTIVPIQLPIKPNWDNTGNAQSQPKNFLVGGNISAYRMDPPTENQQTLERYQTNVYFEHSGNVYVFECVHNWTQDYLDTCNTMLKTLTFISKNTYTCPANGWIDCMPGPNPKPECSKEAMSWYQTNCPNFQGAAL